MNIRTRFNNIKSQRKSYLQEGETLILIRNGEMIAQWIDRDDECLSEVSGQVNKKLQEYLNWLYDDNQY